MEKENSKLISELYGIRGGLSLISEQYDAVCDLESKNKKLSNEKDDLSNDIEEKKKDAAKSLVIADNKLRSFDYEINKSSENRLGAKGIIVLVIIIVGMIAYGVVMLSVIYDANKVFFLIAVAIASVFVVIFVIALILLHISRKKKRRTREYLNSRCKYEEKQYDKAVKEIESEGKKAEQNINLQISKNNEIILLHKQSAMQIKQGIIKSFGHTINESDWKNIDLIIFYFQSGRALTLREALQLVDRQRQTEAIVSELRQACNAICNEIRNGFYSLQEQVKVCFNNLSNQLNMQHIEMMGKMNNMEELLGALNAKASISCERLVEQSEYLSQIRSNSSRITEIQNNNSRRIN